MTIRIVPFVALPTSRWKNGAGIKRDIAEGKLGDGRTGWTFGVADIEGDAPFSCFPDTDRWFLPVSAGLVELNVEPGPDRNDVALLNERSDPYPFPGDVPAACRLLSQPIRVLNVMADRTSYRVSVQKLRFTEPRGFAWASDEIGLVFIIEGKGRLEHDGRSEPLAGYDSLLADGGRPERCTLVPAGEMVALIATVSV